MANESQAKHDFHKLIELAAQPLPSNEEAQRRDDSYTDKQTRSRKAEDTSAKPNDTFRQSNVSTDSKNPQSNS